MTIFQPCPYHGCKTRLQIKFSDKIGEELQTNQEHALAELRKRTAGILKKDHREGRHKNGR